MPSPGGDAIGSITNNKKKETRQNYSKGKRINQREPTNLNTKARHPHDKATFRKNRNERKECQQNQKPRNEKTTFKAVAALCGAGSPRAGVH